MSMTLIYLKNLKFIVLLRFQVLLKSWKIWLEYHRNEKEKHSKLELAINHHNNHMHHKIMDQWKVGNITLQLFLKI